MGRNSLLLNRLRYEINYNLFNKEYRLIRITSNKDIKPGLAILDELLDDNSILSVCYTDKCEVFIMAQKRINILNLREIVSKYDYLGIRECYAEEVNVSVLIQLLFNSLARGRMKEFSFNNLNGYLFVVVPGRINKKQVVTVEIKVDSECCIQLNVRTFTSELLKNKIQFAKGKSFSSYPQYVLTSTNSLRRVYKKEKDDFVYINRQIKNRKNEVPFFEFRSLDSFNKTKIGILSSAMEQVRRIYKDVISLDFVAIPEYITEEHSSAMTRLEKKRISELSRQYRYRIVDFVNDEWSEKLKMELSELLKIKGLGVKEGKYLKNGCCNICIIHEKEYYDQMDDPHDKLQEYENQCITVEAFRAAEKETINSAVDTIIHELIIKADLKNEQITLFDWQVCKYDRNWKYIVKKEEAFLMMDIDPSGKFRINRVEQTLFTYDSFTRYADVFLTDKNVIGLVEDDKGNLNAIKETNLYTLPDYNLIKKELKARNNQLKNRTMREEVMPSILDINYYENDKGAYYCVGLAHDKIMYKSNDAPLIRRIEPVGDSELIFDKVLQQMNVLFVRNGQLTVIPFPFKYLREFKG